MAQIAALKVTNDPINLSPSVKIQIMVGKVCLTRQDNTLLGVVNKLFFRSFSTQELGAFSTNGPYVVLNFCNFFDIMVLILQKILTLLESLFFEKFLIVPVLIWTISFTKKIGGP